MSSPGHGRPRPSLAQTTRLVARALDLSADALTTACRPATWDDLPAILALRQLVLGRHINWDDTAYLSWRYRLGRAQAGGGDCWVVVHDNKLLGMVGTQDLMLHCGGESRPALSLMDILIQPELDGSGLGVWLTLFIQAQTSVTVAIGANAKSIGMVRRLFDALPNRRSYVHPVKLGRFLGKRLPVPALAGLLAPSLEAAMRLGRALLLAPWRRSSSALQVQPIARFDDALNTLDQALRESPLVHTERKPAPLNWRLFDNPRGPCQTWGAWSKGRLLGYVSARLMPQEDGGLALTVLDLAVPLPGHQAALRALLWHMLEEAWRQKVDYVSITAYQHEVEHELRRVGFRHQAHPYEIVGWICRDEHFKQLVTGRTDWTLSEVHTDRL